MKKIVVIFLYFFLHQTVVYTCLPYLCPNYEDNEWVPSPFGGVMRVPRNCTVPPFEDNKYYMMQYLEFLPYDTEEDPKLTSYACNALFGCEYCRLPNVTQQQAARDRMWDNVFKHGQELVFRPLGSQGCCYKTKLLYYLK